MHSPNKHCTECTYLRIYVHPVQICLFFVQYCTSAQVHARAKSAVAQNARALHMQKVQNKKQG